MNKRIRQIAILGVLGFVIGTASAWYTTTKELKAGFLMAQMEPAAGSSTKSTSLFGAAIGGPFSLTDHNGDAVTEANYKESYKLIFFGFTLCPEICPTELQKMTAALKIMGDHADSIQPIFVSTDPERDTPEVMKEYVALFHPRLVGLTGTIEQIKAAQETYKVYAAKVEDPALSDYTMNHSSYTFLMSPDDKPLALFSAKDTPSDIANQIKKVLGQI